MEPMIQKFFLPLGIALLLSACTASPDVHLRQPEPKAETGESIDFTNEAMPKTIDSLEVAIKTGTASIVRVMTGAIFIGSDHAPMLTIYTDYACEYCQKFFIERVGSLKREYIDTGKLSLKIIVIPRDNAGLLMAKVALCSSEQELYNSVDRELTIRPLQSEDQLVAFAKKTGLNLATLKKCMSKESLAQEIERNVSEAKEAGISRVPTFLLKGELWIGVMEKNELIGKIEELLK